MSNLFSNLNSPETNNKIQKRGTKQSSAPRTVSALQRGGGKQGQARAEQGCSGLQTHPASRAPHQASAANEGKLPTIHPAHLLSCVGHAVSVTLTALDAGANRGIWIIKSIIKQEFEAFIEKYTTKCYYKLVVKFQNGI